MGTTNDVDAAPVHAVVTQRCARCDGHMDGMMISCHGGWQCERCHYITHPFQEYATFRDVLHNNDDQVTMRRLIDECVPSDVKRKIRDMFNELMRMRYQMRCSQLGITDADRVSTSG